VSLCRDQKTVVQIGQFVQLLTFIGWDAIPEFGLDWFGPFDGVIF
jgi:hypothetical protein